jgi:hypothetical protein
MRVTDRNRQSIGLVRLRHVGQTQNRLDHMLNLPLVGAAAPNNGLLNLPCSVFE